MTIHADDIHSNVLAYTVTAQPPQPFRFRSTTLRIQLPNFSYLSSAKFFREMRKTATFKFFANIIFTVRTWARRTIWGDRVSYTIAIPRSGLDCVP